MTLARETREMVRDVWEITSRGEWLERRQRDITASRVAALFTDADGRSAHPYMTRDQLAATMRGQSQGSNAAMRRGRILEPAVAAAIAEEKPDWLLRKATTYHRLPDHRIGATPDYFAQEAFAEVGEGLLNVQCKTVSPEVWEKWKGRPPLGYLIQVACENLVTDVSAGVLAVMVTTPSYPLFIFKVSRHAEAEQKILDATAAFWRSFGAGEIAATAPADDLAEMLDNGETIDLSGDNSIRDLLDEHLHLSSVMSVTKKELGSIDHQIKTRIGKASLAHVPGYSISFKAHKRKEYTVPESMVRMLRIARNGGDDEE